MGLFFPLNSYVLPNRQVLLNLATYCMESHGGDSVMARNVEKSKLDKIHRKLFKKYSVLAIKLKLD